MRVVSVLLLSWEFEFHQPLRLRLEELVVDSWPVLVREFQGRLLVSHRAGNLVEIRLLDDVYVLHCFTRLRSEARSWESVVISYSDPACADLVVERVVREFGGCCD